MVRGSYRKAGCPAMSNSDNFPLRPSHTSLIFFLAYALTYNVFVVNDLFSVAISVSPRVCFIVV